MFKDLLLASGHHLLAFALVAMLVTQSVLLSRPLDTSALRRLAGVDRGYGIVAVLLLVIGMLRVTQGIKGAAFYMHNPWFHAKMGLFVLAALLSLVPTFRILRWRKALRADPGFAPSAADAAGLRRFVRFELLLVAAIFVAAAAMARPGALTL